MNPSASRGSPGIVVVGSASRDLAADDPRGWRLGGGVTFSALATARLGLPTAALIGVDDLAAGAHELGLLDEAGVELHLARLDRAPVFVNRETASGRVQTCIEPGQPLPLDLVPRAWRAAAAWIVAPVAGEVDDRWAGLPGAGAFVTVGWQGLLRHLVAGQTVGRVAPWPSALVARADLVGVSKGDLPDGHELEALSGLLRPGAHLIVTRGASGGRLIEVGATGGVAATVDYAATPSSRQIDPTGAGDTFLAALTVAALESGLDLRFASAAGSLVVEGHGLAAVPDRAAVLERMRRTEPAAGP
jgi:sugar/nucleoside kinase (ribokinase family)